MWLFVNKSTYTVYMYVPVIIPPLPDVSETKNHPTMQLQPIIPAATSGLPLILTSYGGQTHLTGTS